MASDPITTEVIANGLKALIYEMDAAIERTSMSVIIREQHDFGMSLVDHRGWVITGTAFAGQSLAEYAAEHPVEPGDVILFNDPYISHGEISHLGDTMQFLVRLGDDQSLIVRRPTPDAPALAVGDPVVCTWAAHHVLLFPSDDAAEEGGYVAPPTA